MEVRIWDGQDWQEAQPGADSALKFWDNSADRGRRWVPWTAGVSVSYDWNFTAANGAGPFAGRADGLSALPTWIASPPAQRKWSGTFHTRNNGCGIGYTGDPWPVPNLAAGAARWRITYSISGAPSNPTHGTHRLVVKNGTTTTPVTTAAAGNVAKKTVYCAYAVGNGKPTFWAEGTGGTGVLASDTYTLNIFDIRLVGPADDIPFGVSGEGNLKVWDGTQWLAV
jgi:hypothetical protein